MIQQVLNSLAYRVVVTIRGDSPTPLSRSINSFANLPEGWHFGSGHPISRQAQNTAHLLAGSVNLFGSRADLVPDLSGGLLLSVGCGELLFDADVTSDGLLFISDDRDDPNAERIADGGVDGSFPLFFQRLSKCRHTSESYRLWRTTRSEDGLKVMPSSETVLGSRSSMRIVR